MLVPYLVWGGQRKTLRIRGGILPVAEFLEDEQMLLRQLGVRNKKDTWVSSIFSYSQNFFHPLYIFPPRGIQQPVPFLLTCSVIAVTCDPFGKHIDRKHVWDFLLLLSNWRRPWPHSGVLSIVLPVTERLRQRQALQNHVPYLSDYMTHQTIRHT